MSVLSDGNIMTGTDDGAVRVWDERIFRKPCIEVKDAHTSRIRGIDQIDSGSMMAVSGSADGVFVFPVYVLATYSE